MQLQVARLRCGSDGRARDRNANRPRRASGHVRLEPREFGRALQEVVGFHRRVQGGFEGLAPVAGEIARAQRQASRLSAMYDRKPVGLGSDRLHIAHFRARCRRRCPNVFRRDARRPTRPFHRSSKAGRRAAASRGRMSRWPIRRRRCCRACRRRSCAAGSASGARAGATHRRRPARGRAGPLCRSARWRHRNGECRRPRARLGRRY